MIKVLLIPPGFFSLSTLSAQPGQKIFMSFMCQEGTVNKVLLVSPGRSLYRASVRARKANTSRKHKKPKMLEDCFRGFPKPTIVEALSPKPSPHAACRTSRASRHNHTNRVAGSQKQIGCRVISYWVSPLWSSTCYLARRHARSRMAQFGETQVSGVRLLGKCCLDVCILNALV